MDGICELCKRVKELSFHHLIPKTLHNNKFFRKLYEKVYMGSYGIELCKDCHHAVHDFWTEKELGKNYNTKEKILNDPKFKKYLKWVKKQK
jgi:hypothetical protein